MTQTTKARVFTPLLVASLVPLLVMQLAGCKKEEPPPPLPSASPAATPPPPAQPIELVPEVAPTVSASAEPPKTTGTGSSSSLSRCCTALTQNAQSAPEPNKTYMLQAAAVCKAAVGAGQASGSAFAGITAALRGAGLPSACK